MSQYSEIPLFHCLGIGASVATHSVKDNVPHVGLRFPRAKSMQSSNLIKIRNGDIK